MDIETEAGGTVVEGAIERMLVTFDDELCRDACLEIRAGLDEGQSTLEPLTRVKGSVASALARRLIDQYPDRSSWPQALRTLVYRLETLLSEPDS